MLLETLQNNIRALLLVPFLIISFFCYSQDSMSVYSRLNCGYTSFNNIQYNIEAGLSIPSADIGIVCGRIADTNYYSLKFNMMSASYGKLMNEFSFGIGTSNRNKNLIDMNTSMLYDLGKYQVGVSVGYINFISNVSYTMNYFNIFLRLGMYNPVGNDNNFFKRKILKSHRK